MRMPSWMVAAAFLSFLGALACQDYIDQIDDDDATADDDDADDDAADDDAADDDAADDDAADDDAADDDAGDDDSEGCGAPVDQALAAIETWTQLVTCADVLLGAAPDANQQLAIAVHLEAEELAYSDGLVETFGLAGNGGTLRLEIGQNLLHYDCNDALWLEEVVDNAWLAVEGTAELEIVEAHEWGDATALISLHDVVIEDPDDSSSRCAVPDVTWGPTSIGWLPG